MHNYKITVFTTAVCVRVKQCPG